MHLIKNSLIYVLFFDSYALFICMCIESVYCDISYQVLPASSEQFKCCSETSESLHGSLAASSVCSVAAFVISAFAYITAGTCFIPDAIFVFFGSSFPLEGEHELS